MDPSSFEIVDNVACLGCGCVCDDLRLTVQNQRIVRAERACAVAEPWLHVQDDPAKPVADIQGKAASFDEAVEEASHILRSADYPLIYGLSQTNTDSQRAAVRLAERLGAVIDSTASLCHAPSIMAQQQVGKVTCTLGEMRNRADLVVFWGTDPVQTHPRHWERYSVDAPGKFHPRGRADRFVVVADTSRTASAEQADFFIPIQPGKHFEALLTLRAMVRDAVGDSGSDHGAPPELLAELARRMKLSRWGAVFFGVNLARGESGHCNVQVLLQLVTDLNAHGRWSAMRMRVQGNVVGADSVLLWQTGYPFSVNLARGYPRYNPGEFSVHGVLERQEADTCLLVGSETLGWLPVPALEYLRRIPTVVLDPASRQPPLSPSVRFRVGVSGIHFGGTAYRMDGVPVPLRPCLPTSYPGDTEVLNRIAQRL